MGWFDAVRCHGVLMYLQSLRPAIAALVAAGDSRTLISTLTRNRAGIAIRAGMSEQWTNAYDGFDANRYTNRLGIENSRADDPEEAISALVVAGCDLVQWDGVRLFTDHWDSRPIPPHFDVLLNVEEEAGRRDPYRQLAALTHVLARIR
jgi:S-adenosylmethionine-dependent methyltransferase